MEISSNKKQTIAKKLCENLGIEGYPSTNGSLLLFPLDKGWSVNDYRKLFQIDDEDSFDKAFGIVAGGAGNEITKIDSAISSSLLSLLFFYKLFNTDNGQSLTLQINGESMEFDKVFFEIRNKVIRKPSCVDVVLVATDGSLLFLESKFTEFIYDRKTKMEYGHGYVSLYEKIKSHLCEQEIQVTNSEGKLVLSCAEDIYIDGIKQSISHLIGMVKGPQKVYKENYPKSYCDNYRMAFKNAPRLIYGTILFNPEVFLEEDIEEYKSYYSLYSGIIGKNGSEIVDAICDEWSGRKEKQIEVLEKPLSYQEVMIDDKNKKYFNGLSDSIKKFYGFDKLQK